MPNPQTQEVAILLFPDFSNHCLANAVEPLRAANTLARRPLYRWSHLGLGTETVRSSSGLPVTPERRLADHPGGAMLLVMPSYHQERHATPATARALRAAARRFAVLAGLDTGAWLLAAAGLLDGRRATIHWDELTRFAETFPEVTVTPERFVAAPPVMTCGGGVTALELMLALIGRDHGPMLALEVGALFMHGERPAGAGDLRVSPDRLVRAAVALMRRNLEAPLPIPALAAQLGVSARSLEARCAAVAGRSPQALYRALRLSAARHLAETTSLTVAEIAARTGYENPSALTRAFRAAHGAPPSAFRAAARG